MTLARSNPPNSDDPTYELSADELRDPEKLYCDDCKHIIESWPWEEEKHQAVSAMKLEECPLCKFLLEKLALEKSIWNWNHDKLVNLHSWADEGDPHAEITSWRRPITDITDNVIGHARNWLQECSTKHLACQEMSGNFLAQPTELPRRILRLDEKEGYIRIHKQKADQKGVYATLSYVWGEQDGATQAPEDAVRNPRTVIDEEGWIATKTLPLAFQDAVELAIKLGLKFLWIHALCVPQDDSDAQKQAKRDFSSIFKHSAVCIRLGNIESVHRSFLRNEGPYMPYPACVVRVTGLEKGDITMKLTSAGRDTGSGMIRHEGSLYSRAWTVGEVFASPRHITITGHNEMTYRCIERTKQNQHSHYCAKTINKSINQYQYGTRVNFSWAVGVWGGSNRAEYWNILAKNIHESETSQLEDKLFIIESIAQDPMWDLGENMFGLWKRDIRRQLLWSTISSYDKDWRRIKVRRYKQVPTWSWASTDAKVLYSMASYMKNWQFRFIEWGSTRPLALSRAMRKGVSAIKLQGKITPRQKLIYECGELYLPLLPHMLDCNDEFDQLDREHLFVLLAGQARVGNGSNLNAGASKGTTSAGLKNTRPDPENSDHSPTKTTTGNAEEISANNVINEEETQEQPGGSRDHTTEPLTSIGPRSIQHQPESESGTRANRGFSDWVGGFPRGLGTRKRQFWPTRERLSGFTSNFSHRFSTGSLGTASAPQENLSDHANKLEANSVSPSDDEDEDDNSIVFDPLNYIYSEDIRFNPRQLAMKDQVEMVLLKQISKNVYERVGLFSGPCRTEWVLYWNEVKLSEFYIV